MPVTPAVTGEESQLPAAVMAEVCWLHIVVMLRDLARMVAALAQKGIDREGLALQMCLG
jgi:hypothetical protein